MVSWVLCNKEMTFFFLGCTVERWVVSVPPAPSTVTQPLCLLHDLPLSLCLLPLCLLPLACLSHAQTASACLPLCLLPLCLLPLCLLPVCLMHKLPLPVGLLPLPLPLPAPSSRKAFRIELKFSFSLQEFSGLLCYKLSMGILIHCHCYYFPSMAMQKKKFIFWVKFLYWVVVGWISKHFWLPKKVFDVPRSNEDNPHLIRGAGA